MYQSHLVHYNLERKGHQGLKTSDH